MTYQYLLGKVSTKPPKIKDGGKSYQYLLGKVSTLKLLMIMSLVWKYQYLLGKVSTKTLKFLGWSYKVSISIR